MLQNRRRQMAACFRPDIVITNEQEATHFVEVERNKDKNIEQRQAK